MKLANKQIKITLILLSLTLCFSCKDDMGKLEWGYSKVYMPQASMLDGGLTNNYPVPLNNNSSTNNYILIEESNLLQIVLGVYRSGKESLKAYSVKVSPNISETEKFMEGMDNVVMLPEETYILPNEVNVKDGDREAIFYLTVDLNKIAEDYPDFATKNICLTVEISDPSNYGLNESLAKTNVIISGSTFLPEPSPLPNLIKGGDMNEGSLDYWEIYNLDKDQPFFHNAVILENGYMKLTYGNQLVNEYTGIIQEVDLVEGKRYKISADFTATGGASETELAISFEKEKPIDGKYYWFLGADVYTYADTWGDNSSLTNGYDGSFMGATGVKKGIDTDGVFTAPFDGKGYFIIAFASWGGNIGTLTFDNVTLQLLD